MGRALCSELDRPVGFGMNGGGMLLNPANQNSKLIANPIPIIVGLVVLGFVLAVVYQSVAWRYPVSIVSSTT